MFKQLVLAGLLAATNLQSAPSLTCVDPLVKVFRGATDLPPAIAEAHVAVGEYATIQFVFRSPVSVTDLSATVSGLRGAQVRYVGYVQVGKTYPTAPPDTLTSPDRRFPDPLLEDKSIAVAADQNQPIWITVPARSPGIFRGTLTLRWSGGELRGPFTVHVHKVKMKKPRLWVTNWYFPDTNRLAMIAGHPVEPYSKDYWKCIRQMAEIMAAYHQNVARISPLDLGQYSRTGDQLSFDFSRFDKTVRIFMAAGVIGRIEGSHVGKRAGSDWKSSFIVWVPNGSGGYTNLPATDPEARNFYRQFFPALIRHLKTRGWDKIYTQHLVDEPIDENADSYRDIANLLRESEPAMRVIEATQTPKLVGCVNTWVPVLHHFHRDYDFFRERQKAGDEVWFYTCTGPKTNYANRFIEQPLIKPRLLHWINFRYNATGYLHWGFNYWNLSTSPFDETRFNFPGGDQWIVYPKNGRLLSSIRLEAMRDGIADYELLSMLAERNSALAQKLAAESILDFNSYDTDITNFRARRLKMLKALEN